MSQGPVMYIYMRVNTVPNVDTWKTDTLTSGNKHTTINTYSVRYTLEGEGYALFVAPINTYPQSRDTNLLFFIPVFLFISIAPFLVLFA